jgi:integrase
MPQLHLTTESVKGIELPEAGQMIYWDSKLPGFGLRVGTRTKTFVAEKRVAGRTVRVSLGLFGHLTVAQARNEAAVKLGQMAGGVDVNAQRRAADAQRHAEKAERRARAEYTVAKLCDRYVDYLRKLEKPSAIDAANIFKNWVKATEFASTPARDLTPKEAATLIRRAIEAGKGRTAAKLRSYLRAAYGLAQGAETNPQAPSTLLLFGIETNPVAATAALSSFSKTRSVVVTEQFLGEVLKLLRRRRAEQYDDALAALELSLLLAGQRPRQVLQLDASDVNSDDGTVTLRDPKGRRKEPRRHVLPLMKDASALMREILKHRRADWLFGDKRARTNAVTLSRKGGEVIAAAAAKLPAGAKMAGVQPRDIRRTAETMLASMGISKDLRAQVLSHGLGGVQDRHYDRHEYLAEKRKVLKAWEAKLQQLVDAKPIPTNVKELRRAR